MKIKRKIWARPCGVVKGNIILRSSPAFTVQPPTSFFSQVKLFKPSSEKHSCEGSFHNAIFPIATLAMFFGVMPINNVSSKCPLQLTFIWKSFRFTFAVFVMLSCGLEAVLAVAWTFTTHIEFGKMVILVYYITNFMSFFCFLKLSATWPTLMTKWHEVETKLPQMKTRKETFAMSRSIRKTAAIILTLSAIEHILSIVSSVAVVVDCPLIKNILQAYYVHNFPQVFSFFGYSHVFGIYVKFIHITSTFVWSYADLFIMMVSCGLAAKFKQINDRLFEDKGKVKKLTEERYIELL
jgi:gustatory receptor